jgi:hypothetical protein
MVAPMPLIRPLFAPRGRWSWLLALALLLPLAQAMATWHGYSHSPNAVAQGDDPQAAQLDHCERCLAAAALGGGALPSLPHGLPVPTARHEKPSRPAVGVWPARVALAYRSRAPPSIPR